MKLEVGQFARLKSGYSDELGIGKIDFVANCGVATIDFKNKKLGVFASDIVKASYNIIDILEVGDYVNGNKVDFTNNNNKLSYEDKCIGFYDGDGDITLFENGIKSVVTHEQMEQMAYKVGE